MLSLIQKTTFIVYLFIFVSIFGCAQKATQLSSTLVSINPDIYKNVPFVDYSQSPSPYLAVNVAFEPLAEIRSYIENKDKVVLKHRGEAHITVINPLEFEQLKSSLTMKLINEVALLNRIQETPFELVCLGKGEKRESGKVLRTYFIVVNSPELLSLRHTLATLYKTQGGLTNEYKPDDYFPHITVGFTERDLHAQDGVIKNKVTCFSDMQIKAQ